MSKIVVLNRMHLDEWPAEQVDALLHDLRGHPEISGFSRRAPDPGAGRRRGYDRNITHCFPGRPDGDREERDAWRITRLSQGADLVLDIHGTRDPDEVFAFYGPAGRRSPMVRGTASLLASEHAVVIGAPHPAGVLPNYAGWDLGPGSPVLGELPGWLTRIAAGWIPPARPMTEYRYAGPVRADDAARLGLRRRYPPFARLPDQALRALGLPTPGYALSWDAELYGATTYWGEVVIAPTRHETPTEGEPAP